MKKQFSTHWKASRQPRKQRKYKARAPLHIQHKLVNANLSKELRKKYKRRSFPLRKGDSVKIMRGSFKGKTGKVEKVEVKRARASIEKIQRAKKDGTKVEVFFPVSNLQIKELQLEDKERTKALERNIKKEGKESSLGKTFEKTAKAEAHHKTEGKEKKEGKEKNKGKEENKENKEKK